ncbi:MAG: hypothetical protein KDD42_03320, partial [Bdellovibrionales bacterium]|nr:hypothetical protein [Bdellovibrionales bacterium]
EGWPRVELSLIDSHAPNRSDFGMVVSADDHKERGLIGIAMKSGELLGEIELAQPEQLKKLPVILKRSVRSFLDQVGAYVLNPPKPEDLIEVSTRPIHLDNFEEQDSKAADSLAEEDVFADETDAYSPSQNVVEQDDPADYFEPLAIPTK